MSVEEKDSQQPAPKKGRGQSGSVSRRLILDVAAAMFSAQGFTETSMREIAAKAGMRAPSVYYHFTSKEQILSEILSIAIRSTNLAVRESVERLPADAAPRRKIEAAVGAHVRSLHRNIHYTATSVRYQGQVPQEVALNVRADRETYADYWQQLLAEAAASGDLSPTINRQFLQPLILGSMNHTINWYDAGRGNLEELILTVLALFKGMWPHQDR